MNTPMPRFPASPRDLPRDAQSILELAARSMFDLFANASEGMLLVDREARVVWINDQYRRFLPALGFTREEDFVGHPVSAVVQNTQMHKVLETGKPILIDLLSNRAGTFVVSRIPLRDADGAVIGALGIVLFDQPETNLQPLIAKFSLAQRDLDEARRELATQRLKHSAGKRQSKYTFTSFVGTSAAAVEVKRQARRAAQSSSPVLLLGETGTGKELLAHAIHASSARAQGPFISVNIAAVPDTLLEAEFFGVAPGAYTGAERKGRDGKFRLADGGTLFLDEIGDMPLALQAKLLRALQEGEIEPLGSNKLIPFDARVICRHLARSGEAGARRQLSRRPVLPPQRAADPGATAARAQRRPGGAGRGSRGGHGAAKWRTTPRTESRGAGAAGPPDLARQHPRTAQRAGTGGHAGRLALPRARADRGRAARDCGCAHWPGGRRVPAGTEAGRRFGRAGVPQPAAPAGRAGGRT
jgi:hypothetical protein